MVHKLFGLGKYIALANTSHERDVRSCGKRQLQMTVHRSGESEVGQREQRTTLTNIAAIEMTRGDKHRNHPNFDAPP